MLQELRRQHLKLGMISNCTEEEVRHWEHSELADCFDSVIFSFEAGVAKPDLRIYEMACSRSGIQPEEAIFVGDGGSNELQGAEQAGMIPYHAVWFNNTVESPYIKLDSPNKLILELEKISEVT